MAILYLFSMIYRLKVPALAEPNTVRFPPPISRTAIERISTGGLERPEDVFEALSWIEIGALFVEDMNNPIRCQIVEMNQEFIRVHNGNIERVCCLCREVAPY